MCAPAEAAPAGDIGRTPEGSMEKNVAKNTRSAAAVHPPGEGAARGNKVGDGEEAGQGGRRAGKGDGEGGRTCATPPGSVVARVERGGVAQGRGGLVLFLEQGGGEWRGGGEWGEAAAGGRW
jgi:hypothetical protein